MMPSRRKSRLRSMRGQTIMKEWLKEEHMRRANLNYLRSSGVANGDGRQVCCATQPTKQRSIEDNNSKCKDALTRNENLEALPMGPNKSNPATSKLNNHFLSSSKTVKDIRCGDEISLEEETPISMKSKNDIPELGNSRDKVSMKVKATFHSTNNVESLPSTSVYNQSILSLETTQAHMQIGCGSQPTNSSRLDACNVQRSPLKKSMEGSKQPQFKAMDGLIHKENIVNGVTKYNVCPSIVKGATEGLGSDGEVQHLDVSNSKALKSEQRYMEINEDDYGNVYSKNPISIQVEEVNNLTCVGDDTKVVTQLENMTCKEMKKQREIKQDIEPHDSYQSIVDIDGDCGGDIRTRFSIETTNKNLMASDGKIHEVMSSGRIEPMQEKTHFTLGDILEEDVEDEEEVTRVAEKKWSRYIVTSNEEVEVDGVDHDYIGFESQEREESMQEKIHVTLADDGDDEHEEEEVSQTYEPKMKRRRYIETREDEEDEAHIVDHGAESKEGEVSKVEVISSMDCIANVYIPLMAEYVEQQCYYCSKPIDEPVWRGTLKIDGKEYISLVGHLSTKSGEKVWKLSRSLQMTVKVMKLSSSDIIRRIWNSSKPTDDNIGLYFFPHEMRYDANLDQLTNEVMENNLVLQAVIGEAEMLIFPSCILPERYKKFQGRHYLWALFKRREDKFVVGTKLLNDTPWCVQEEKKGKRHVSSQQDDVDDVEPNKEIILKKSAMVNSKSPAEGTQEVSASYVPGTTNIDYQVKAPDARKQVDVRCKSVHAAEATAAAANSAAGIAEAASLATNAADVPTNHEQFNSSAGVSPGKVLFIARKTPRVEQILLEMDRDESLLFSMLV